MKKSLFIAPAVLIFSLTGCGQIVEEFDPNKTQIFVNVFNGGYGTEWFEDIRTKFNSQNDKYEVIMRPKKMEATDIITDVQTGNPDADVYFSCGVDFQRGIYQDYFEDLSDVLEMKPDGEDGKTIAEKMVDLDLWKSVSSKYGQGVYILPHSQTLMGMVFDYKLFVENNWLTFASTSDIEMLESQGIQYKAQGAKLKFVSSTSPTNYKVDDYILSAGKDGIFGTYDDGQPTTMEEFDVMLNKITKGSKAASSFIFSGVAENYLNDFYASIIGQYGGAEQYRTLFNFDSKGQDVEMHLNNDKAISLSNGYEIFKSESVYKGLNFVEKYLSAPEVDDKVLEESSFSHTDAQNQYLLGYKKNTGFPAILIEGTWWENEAKTMFEQIAKQDPERGFGKREYRYFVTPNISGQKTDENKSVMGGAEYAGIVVAKQKNSEKLSKIKEFLSFCNSDENLVNFTKYTGCKKYFKYDMSESDLQSLTPFARNNFEIMSDTNHIDILPSRLYQAANPLTFTTTYISNCYVPLYTGTIYTMFPARYFRNTKSSPAIATVDELYSSKSDWLGYKKDVWDEFITSAQAQGFFK